MPRIDNRTRLADLGPTGPTAVAALVVAAVAATAALASNPDSGGGSGPVFSNFESGFHHIADNTAHNDTAHNTAAGDNPLQSPRPAKADTEHITRAGASLTGEHNYFPGDAENPARDSDVALVATVSGDGIHSLAGPTDGPTEHWFPNPTQFGGPRVFRVIDNTSSPDYVKVSLPLMPNGQQGWLPRSGVEISGVDHHAVVNLSEDSLTVWDGEDIIVDTRAVTGKATTPTPLGVFYVRDIIHQPNSGGAYGPYIIALSGFSEVLDTFGGGLPAIAIHGTNNPGVMGQELSNGCVRIPNDLVTKLATTVPLGTPVTIVRA